MRATGDWSNKEIKRIDFTRTKSETKRGKTGREKTRALVSIGSSSPRVLKIGENRKFKLPSDAAREAKEGDAVEIDAGTYRKYYAKWSQNDITIRGIGGMAHLKSKGLIRNRKAI